DRLHARVLAVVESFDLVDPSHSVPGHCEPPRLARRARASGSVRVEPPTEYIPHQLDLIPRQLRCASVFHLGPEVLLHRHRGELSEQMPDPAHDRRLAATRGVTGRLERDRGGGTRTPDLRFWRRSLNRLNLPFMPPARQLARQLAPGNSDSASSPAPSRAAAHPRTRTGRSPAATNPERLTGAPLRDARGSSGSPSRSEPHQSTAAASRKARRRSSAPPRDPSRDR